MELKLVEQLIDKYFEGQTTLAEEQQLKAYFSSKDVAQNLVKYQSIFGYFEAQKEIEFEQKIALQSKKQFSVKWIGIAASFVVLFGVATFYFYPSEPENQDLGTYDNPEEALVETHKALLMISEQVNIGMKNASHLKEFEQTKKSIFK